MQLEMCSHAVWCGHAWNYAINPTVLDPVPKDEVFLEMICIHLMYRRVHELYYVIGTSASVHELSTSRQQTYIYI